MEVSSLGLNFKRPNETERTNRAVTISDAENAEMTSARKNKRQTVRPTCTRLEKILHVPMPVLDHGFIRVVDYMGEDSSIVQAARVSYGRGTRRKTQDRDLIHYLMRHNHTTPFEMAEIKLHVKLPIFVARQWIRHRTASVNEYSARYSLLDKEFYLPEARHLAAQSFTNRQGRMDTVSDDEASYVLQILREDAEIAYEHYLDLLNEDEEGNTRTEKRAGLARELARMNLSVNFYTQWYWKIDLHNLMRFIRLRSDSHAQYEIRAYAETLMKVLKLWVPITAEAFREYQLESISLSASAINVLRKRLQGEVVDARSSGLSRREWDEVSRTFDLS